MYERRVSITIYCHKGKVYIPHSARHANGFGLLIEPVDICSRDDSEGLRKVLESRLRSDVPMPVLSSIPKSDPAAKASGVRPPARFEAEADVIMCDVVEGAMTMYRLERWSGKPREPRKPLPPRSFGQVSVSEQVQALLQEIKSLRE